MSVYLCSSVAKRGVCKDPGTIYHRATEHTERSERVVKSLLAHDNAHPAFAVYTYPKSERIGETMIRLPATPRLAFALLLICGIILQGCASSGKPEPDVKIGMYIDAVLEFVVEYPLSWNKERRLIFGRTQGEVRWTHPDHPHTLIRIKSYIPEQQTFNIEQQIGQALHEYVGLEVSSREAVTLPAGEAWHITGSTAQGDADIYLFLRAAHSYSIDLTTPPGSIDNYTDVMDRVIHSFHSMPQESPGPGTLD